MANLIALAKEFGVSVAELTETPERPKHKKKAEAPEPPDRNRQFWENIRLFLFPIWIALLTLVLFAVGLILWTNLKPDSLFSAAPPPEDARPSGTTAPLPETEFYLYWNTYAGGGSHLREFLALGPQKTGFPFDAALEFTAPEEPCDTDFSGMTYHKADCGGITVGYNHIEDEDGTWDTVTSLSDLQSCYATPRGITTGETEDDLLLAYEDLVYCLKETE